MSERTIQNGYLIAAQSDIEALRLRVKELEAVVRAADRIRSKVTYQGVCTYESDWMDYDIQRAAVGEIGAGN